MAAQVVARVLKTGITSWQFPPSDVIPAFIPLRGGRAAGSGALLEPVLTDSYFRLSATATATATVAPTMGLLPMPRKPIIST